MGLPGTWAPPVGLLLCMALALTASSSAGLDTPTELACVREFTELSSNVGLVLGTG